MHKRACEDPPNYVPDIPIPAFREAVWQLYEERASGTAQHNAKQVLDRLDCTEGVFRVGVRCTRGKWLGVAAGMITAGARKTEFRLASRALRSSPYILLWLR